MESLIQKLVETPGPSGYETEVRRLVQSQVEPLAAQIHTDGLGNLIARSGELRAGGKRILLMAGLDEPGLIASHIDRQGLVRFMPLGELRPEACAGQRVRFLNGAAGVVGFAPGGKLDDFESLFVDVGGSEIAGGPEITGEAGDGAPVQPGDIAVFEGPFTKLGRRLSAKALGDRAGAAVLIDVLRRLHDSPQACPHEVHFAFVTQERVGLRGAGAAAFQTEPEVALWIGAAEADAVGGGRSVVRLGQGPAVRVRDSRMLCDPRVVEWICQAAEAAGLPLQREISDGASSGARTAQLGGKGAAAGVLSIPCRYRGGPVQVMDPADMQRTADLVLHLLQNPVSF